MYPLAWVGAISMRADLEVGDPGMRPVDPVSGRKCTGGGPSNGTCDFTAAGALPLRPYGLGHERLRTCVAGQTCRVRAFTLLAFRVSY